jgi:dTDP-4-amino-4,6-dideoxygalactose transaminase
VLDERAARGRVPAAVIAVDLYGSCADYDRIGAACARHDVPLVEDAAEALGATWGGQPAGSFGVAGVVSFNGNKIITTSGGGAVVTNDAAIAARARHLAEQAREPARHYEHSDVGFNYQLSGVLAALGRAQLADLARRLERRAQIEAGYRAALEGRAGVEVVPRAGGGRSNHWLTVLTIDPEVAGATRDDVIEALERVDIESRPAWKPMHRQPVYAESERVLTGVADRVFDHGVCLPSGTTLTDADQKRVIDTLAGVLTR